MKKNLFFITALIMTLILAACGSEEAKSTEKEKTVETSGTTTNKTIEDGDVAKLFTSPKKFKGYNYSFVGKVFVTPEKDDDGVYLQVFADPKNSEYNTIVGFGDPNIEVAEGDYVKVDGVIEDEFEGENMMGGTVLAPVIQANSLEVLSYVDAVAPTVATLTTGDTVDQNGFVVKVEKIEFAEPHTRLYLTVTNNSNDNISFYSHSVKLVSNGSQYEEEYDYEAGLPELQSDVLPGVSTSGVITFPAMDPAITELQVHAEGYSENYDIEIKPFVFTVKK